MKKKGGDIVETGREGIGDVFSRKAENRTLVSDEPDDLLKNGFRGTSWYLAEDMYSMIDTSYMVLPEHVKIPDHHIRK